MIDSPLGEQSNDDGNVKEGKRPSGLFLLEKVILPFRFRTVGILHIHMAIFNRKYVNVHSWLCVSIENM